MPAPSDWSAARDLLIREAARPGGISSVAAKFIADSFDALLLNGSKREWTHLQEREAISAIALGLANSTAVARTYDLLAAFLALSTVDSASDEAIARVLESGAVFMSEEALISNLVNQCFFKKKRWGDAVVSALVDTGIARRLSDASIRATRDNEGASTLCALGVACEVDHRVRSEARARNIVPFLEKCLDAAETFTASYSAAVWGLCNVLSYDDATGEATEDADIGLYAAVRFVSMERVPFRQAPSVDRMFSKLLKRASSQALEACAEHAARASWAARSPDFRRMMIKVVCAALGAGVNLIDRPSVVTHVLMAAELHGSFEGVVQALRRRGRTIGGVPPGASCADIRRLVKLPPPDGAPRWKSVWKRDKGVIRATRVGKDAAAKADAMALLLIDEEAREKAFAVTKKTGRKRGPAQRFVARALRTDACECVVCLDNERARACVPCGHRCMCKGCAETFVKTKAKRCPVCLIEVMYLEK